MLREKVREWFQEAIRLNQNIDPDLQKKLLRDDHPNLNYFFDNLTTQLDQADRECVRRGIFIKPKTMQDTVYDMANFFVCGIEMEARRRHESDIQKSMRDAERSKVKEFEDVLSGNPTGEFAEAGVITNEKTDKEREDYLEAQDQARLKES